MRLWEENRKILTGVGVAFLSLLAAYFVIVRPLGRGAEKLTGSYEELSVKLVANRTGPYDHAGAISSLARSNKRLNRDIKNITKSVEIEFHPWTKIPPEYSSDPGVYFRQKHQQQVEELGIECSKGKPPVALLAHDLGFEEIVKKGFLQDAEARENLNRLSIVRRLVLLLVKAGVREIVEILPSPPVMTGPEGYPKFIREYPVRIRVRTQLDPLMRFLHDVRRPGEFFLVVRELDVQALDPYGGKGRDAKQVGDETSLLVAISAAGMRFASGQERAEMSKTVTRRATADVARPRYKPGQALGH